MRRNPASAVRPALSGDQVRNGRRPLSARYEGTRAVVNPLGCCAAESCESCANDAHFPGCLGVLRNWPCNRSEEHTSELQSLMRISYAVFCLKKKTKEITLDYSKERLTTKVEKNK